MGDEKIHFDDFIDNDIINVVTELSAFCFKISHIRCGMITSVLHLSVQGTLTKKTAVDKITSIVDDFQYIYSTHLFELYLMNVQRAPQFYHNIC